MPNTWLYVLFLSLYFQAGILPVHPRTYLEADRRRKELATAQSLSSQHESESSIENEAVEKDTNEDSNDK